MFSSLRKKIRGFIGTESLDFIRHSRNYISGSVIQNVFVALSLPLYTHLLTTEEYGIISIFTTLVTLMTIVFGLNLRGGIVRYYLEKAKDFDRALGSNLIFIVGFMAVAFTVAFIFRHPLAQMCRVDTEVFLFAAIVAVLAVSTEIYLTYLGASNQSSRHSILQVFKTVGSLVLTISLILLLSERKYLGKMYAEMFIVGVFSVYAFVALGKLSKFSFERKYIQYTLRFSIPLIPHAMSRFILGYFDRIIIQQLTNAAATGVYSFAYDVGMAMNLIVMATVKAWRPIFFADYKEKNLEKLNRMAAGYANSIYFIAIGIILFAMDVVMLLAEKSFYAALELIPIVVLGYVFVFLYTLFFQYASFRKRTELISLSTFIAGFANIGLNYWLIPIFGYQAAAYTTLASYALLFTLHYSNARFVLREKVLPLKLLLPNFLIVVAVAAIYLVLSNVITSYWLFLLIRLGLLGLAALYFISIKKKATQSSPEEEE